MMKSPNSQYVRLARYLRVYIIIIVPIFTSKQFNFKINVIFLRNVFKFIVIEVDKKF